MREVETTMPPSLRALKMALEALRDLCHDLSCDGKMVRIISHLLFQFNEINPSPDSGRYKLGLIRAARIIRIKNNALHTLRRARSGNRQISCEDGEKWVTGSNPGGRGGLTIKGQPLEHALRYSQKTSRERGITHNPF